MVSLQLAGCRINPWHQQKTLERQKENKTRYGRAFHAIGLHTKPGR